MLRRTATLLALMVTGLLAAAQLSWADDYVPTHVAPTTAAMTTVPAPAASNALSYTGAGFNVGGTVAIAVAVLLVGVVLCLFGARMVRGGKH